MTKLLPQLKRLTGLDRCPDEQELSEYADQQLIGKERHAIERHLASCDRCLQQVGFLVRVSELPMHEVPEDLLRTATSLGTEKAVHSFPRWQWASAAALVVVSVLAVVAWKSGMQTGSATPGGHAAPVIAQVSPAQTPKPEEVPSDQERGKPNLISARLSFPRPGETVDAEHSEFRWEPVPGAEFYQVAVLSEDGDTLWEGRTSSTSIHLPAHVILVKGHAYFVWLHVHRAQRETEISKPVRFIAG